MVIRVGVPDDAPAVALVHDLARRAYYAAGGASVAPGPQPADPTGWRRALASAATIRVAEVEGAVVGLVCADRPQHGGPPGAVEMVALHVVPEQWGTGVAELLHDQFLEVLGGRPGVLDVWARNARAIAFYRRHGWTFDGRGREGVDGSPFLGMGR